MKNTFSKYGAFQFKMSFHVDKGTEKCFKGMLLYFTGTI